MKSIYILLLSSLVIIYSGCKERTETKKDFISIDMNQYETVDFNSLIESVSSVKLQHNGIPAFEYCRKIIQNANYYYLLVQNRTGYEVLIFEDSGKLAKQITFNGQHYFINTIFIHFGRIDKIKKFKGEYYICSSNGQFIHRFDSKGKFVSSLNSLGAGPEEYLRIEDFDVCEVNGETEIWVSDNHNLKIYDALHVHSSTRYHSLT